MRARLNTPLKQFLAANGIRQSWLADEIGVSRQEMWTWVNGIHVPAEGTRRSIASTLGKTTDAAEITALVEQLWPVTTEEAEAA